MSIQNSWEPQILRDFAPTHRLFSTDFTEGSQERPGQDRSPEKGSWFRPVGTAAAEGKVRSPNLIDPPQNFPREQGPAVTLTPDFWPPEP